MAILPMDIDAVITRVYRRGDSTLLPRTDAAQDKYDQVLKEAFRDGQVINITEFDYGRSFRYLIVLSKDPDAGALDIKRIARAVQRNGPVEVINLAISLLAPYAAVQFVRYCQHRGGVEREQSENPFSEAQAGAAETLARLLAQEKVQRIDPEVAVTVVPDVQTDLCDVGEATVADCLFYG